MQTVNRKTTTFATAAIASLAAAFIAAPMPAPAQAQAQAQAAAEAADTVVAMTIGHAPNAAPVPVKDFDVFVDLPTGFAYIKTPVGWKFIRKLDAEQLTRLHPSTLVTLMRPEREEIRYALPVAPADAPQKAKGDDNG